jgi:ubiquinone/menaquinone biosynthesis C-methylase UbiE
MAEPYEYVGAELHLFTHAKNWKTYLRRMIGPHISGEVLEVGAGIGSTTRFLCESRSQRWTCLEPDARQGVILGETIREAGLEGQVEVVTCALSDLPRNRLFDSIIYIDVLEHIEDDAQELRIASRLLRVDGKLIVVAPAHQCLFSEFDTAIGHFRRYNVSKLRRIGPEGLVHHCSFYLDSLGLIVSLTNRLFLRQSMPSLSQILTWDRIIVPASRVMDYLCGFRLGKTCVAVWRRPAPGCGGSGSPLNGAPQ